MGLNLDNIVQEVVSQEDYHGNTGVRTLDQRMPLLWIEMKRRKSKGDWNIQMFSTLTINRHWTGLCELTQEAGGVVNHGHPRMLHKLGSTAELWQHL